MVDLEAMRLRAKQMLTPARYHHCMCVQKQAGILAAQVGEDIFEAMTAGLLHDITHCWSEEQQLNYLGESGILLDEITFAHPQIWHAITGSLFVQHEMKIKNPAIVSAIRYHTTGKKDMTTLQKVVYLADLISEDRHYPDVEDMRHAVALSLDEGMRYSLRFTVGQLIKQGLPVVRECGEAYNCYCSKPQTS